MPFPEACPCGRRVDDPLVVDELDWSTLDWLIVFFGVSRVPAVVRRRCSSCGSLLGEVTDYEGRRKRVRGY
jgi:hypothetical protein